MSPCHNVWAGNIVHEGRTVQSSHSCHVGNVSLADYMGHASYEGNMANSDHMGQAFYRGHTGYIIWSTALP